MREQNSFWMIVRPEDAYLAVDYDLKLSEEYVTENYDILNAKMFYREIRIHLLRRNTISIIT
ncbi:MAG: hypothetical protein A2162_00600 [Deltaproteobacteria bacterium RBG_13_52_11b]|nr:MAG: hypothetical protein A2162_00600 [Deltaproteobacteria bacterium RBG_13_52_11b]